MLPVELRSCFMNEEAVPWGEKGLGLSVLLTAPILDAGEAGIERERQEFQRQSNIKYYMMFCFE